MGIFNLFKSQPHALNQPAEPIGLPAVLRFAVDPDEMFNLDAMSCDASARFAVSIAKTRRGRA